VASSLAVFEAAIRVKLMHLIKSRLKVRKWENIDIEDILHKSSSETSFRHRIHSLLRRADATGSDDVIYRIW